MYKGRIYKKEVPNHGEQLMMHIIGMMDYNQLARERREVAKALVDMGLAGNVGNMSATYRGHVEKLPNLGQHACWCQHKKYVDTRILHQKSPTNCRYCSTYRYCSTHPKGWKYCR